MRDGRYYESIICSKRAKSAGEKLDDEIHKEMHSAEPDIHRVYRLEEAKRLQNVMLFSGAFSKYMSPW